MTVALAFAADNPGSRLGKALVRMSVLVCTVGVSLAVQPFAQMGVMGLERRTLRANSGHRKEVVPGRR